MPGDPFPCTPNSRVARMPGEHQSPATSRSLLSIADGVTGRYQGWVAVSTGEWGHPSAALPGPTRGSACGDSRHPIPRKRDGAVEVSIRNPAASEMPATQYRLPARYWRNPVPNCSCHSGVACVKGKRGRWRPKVGEVSPWADRAVLEKRNRRSSAAQSLGVPRTVLRRCRVCGWNR